MVRVAEGRKIPVERLAASAFKKISTTETPQGIALLAEIRGDSLPEKGPCVYLDCVQDPGNVGAVVRTAAASGFSAVIAGKGTADFFSPKAVRGSAGGIAAIACVRDETGEALGRLKKRGCRLVAADCREGKDFRDFPYGADMVLIMGNEGEGISPVVLSLADRRVRIPLQGEMKSLNIAVAFGILAFAAQSKIKEAP
jgi:TrmH family RNA methyltransferase